MYKKDQQQAEVAKQKMVIKEEIKDFVVCQESTS